MFRIHFSSWYVVISILLGGLALQKDHNVQYVTIDMLEVFCFKARLNFPLALHIKISFYIIYLALLPLYNHFRWFIPSQIEIAPSSCPT